MRGPLTIVHVLSDLAVGGGERVSLQLARWQRERGHDASAVTLSRDSGPLRGAFERAGVPIAARPRWLRGLDPALVLRLARLFRRRAVDVVHSHSPLALVYAAPAARLAGGCAVVHTKHGVADDLPRRLWLRRRAARLVHAFVAVSRATAAVAAERHEARGGQLTTIDNGVDTEVFRPSRALRRAVRAELGIPPSSFVLGSVGRLEAIKQPLLLLEAVAPQLGPRCHLVLAGDGPLSAPIAARATRLGCAAHVHQLGLRHDIARLLSGLDLFLMASRSEGAPLALLEAMATALPVIAPRVGGIPEVVDHGVDGLLVSPGSREALAGALEALRGDQRRARSMGNHARSRVADRYSLQRMNGEYLRLYRQLLPRTAAAARVSTPTC